MATTCCGLLSAFGSLVWFDTLLCLVDLVCEKLVAKATVDV